MRKSVQTNVKVRNHCACVTFDSINDGKQTTPHIKQSQNVLSIFVLNQGQMLEVEATRQEVFNISPP